MNNSTWDPTVAGQRVRLVSKPTIQGVTTGEIRPRGSQVSVRIHFDSGEYKYEKQHQVEPCESNPEFSELLRERRFGGLADLRQIITLEKTKGRLTNVFYSMKTSQTKFYPHQYKPILKFLNSNNRGLLIADEVGLGKTIEAMYVWKELQVRERAHNLLIVCPAMLCEKWKSDLQSRFNINARIVRTKELIETLEDTVQARNPLPFACITSLEGLRRSPGDLADDKNMRPSAKLARLLRDHPANNTFSLLDLVIIDEAHYLRNASTESYKLGERLRGATNNFLLLSATPVQTCNRNLHNLLCLLNPQEVQDLRVFESKMDANKHIVRALHCLWSTPHNIGVAKKELEIAAESRFFKASAPLKAIQSRLSELAQHSEAEKIIELGYEVEKVSLFDPYVSRSRKRDVLPKRVQRKVETLKVHFSPREKVVYDRVSDIIRQKCRNEQGAGLFALIMRQRQMASCMVATLESWQKDGVSAALSVEEIQEACGYEAGLEAESEKEIKALLKNDREPIKLSGIEISAHKAEIKQLRADDTKYNQLIDFLRPLLAVNSGEKFVVFAYFKATLHYLQERLEEDGISVTSIMGGMGAAKGEAIAAFTDPAGPAVLLSSQVGSEGIDLQHARYMVNYDLPWNPMRVEQRIGRIDRIGQASDQIYIVNFSLIDTVEERILERLYERIKIFEESIGGLEDILGEKTRQLVIGLYQSGLSAAQQEEQLAQTEKAFIKQKIETQMLEDEAVNIMSSNILSDIGAATFSDYTVKSIEESEQQGRWFRPAELEKFVEDCLKRYYGSGYVFRPHESDTKDTDNSYANGVVTPLIDVCLSKDAQKDFHRFLIEKPSAARTTLDSRQVTCFFDPVSVHKMKRHHELIDSTHPLIEWLSTRCQSDLQMQYPLAIQLKADDIHLPADVSVPSLYAFSICSWEIEGIKRESELSYQLIRCCDRTPLSSKVSEQTILSAIHHGTTQYNAGNAIENIEQVEESIAQCQKILDTDFFDRRLNEFEADNERRCDIQAQSAIASAERQRMPIEASILAGKMVAANEGRLRIIENILVRQLEQVNSDRELKYDQPRLLAKGILFVR